MDVLEKLRLLTQSAKFDVACTSSGIDRKAGRGETGNASACGICHSFSGDGRCISLLKVLMTNSCIYDCKYCVNRRSNDVPRVTFSPRELAELTMNFYRRNYIEGLFLSSGILRDPDYTCERITECVRILREEFHFSGYIHAKAIPGADPALLSRLGAMADRMSVNIELPSQKSLDALAPDKSKAAILKPMGLIRDRIDERCTDLVRYRHTPVFAPAGQSTQMIIGASPESDFQILHLTESLYQKYRLKRVFFSAYIPVNENALLPALNSKPPLLREHRLYQADWLLRFYGFSASEILDTENSNLNTLVDPKAAWALRHPELFPVEINTAPYAMLLRIPGIGVTCAKKIVEARRVCVLDYEGLKKLRVVLKRAQYFITCKGRYLYGLKVTPDATLRAMVSEEARNLLPSEGEQLSFFLPEGIRCLQSHS